MKKTAIPVLSILLLMGSCTKTEKTAQTNDETSVEAPAADTAVIPETNETGENSGDRQTKETNDDEEIPSNNSTQPDIPKGPTDGVVTTENYIYSDYPSDNLPMEKLTRTITNENQVVYVKIQDAKQGETFNINVEHKKPDGNIAITHIYGPGIQEGPFGRATTYTIPKNGDYTFAFTKNSRAAGSQLGDILITLVKK